MVNMQKFLQDIVFFSGDVTTSKVRIPAKMVGKLIGERGKTVVEISRDSKCRVTRSVLPESKI